MTNNQALDELRHRLRTSVRTILTHALGAVSEGRAHLDDEAISWEWIGGVDAIDASAIIGRTIPWVTVDDVSTNRATLTWFPSGPANTTIPGMEPLTIHLRRMP